MAHTEKQLLISWLNDAHAMEGFKQRMLKGFLVDYKDLPELHENLLAFIEETTDAERRLAQCLDELGEKPARGKDILSQISGALQGIGSSAFADAAVKDTLAMHAVGHFAHICYTSLVRAADRLDEPHISEECQDLSDQSEDLANWALDQVAKVTDHVMDTSTRA